MESFGELKRIMATLREPGGCPWDREQTVETVKHYLLEECYELLEALEGSDTDAICSELGDCLLQVVFLSRLFEERSAFKLDDVVVAISQKMTRRHPHVFGDTTLETTEQVLTQWSELKAKERGTESQPSSQLDGIPKALPALQKSWLIGERVSQVGFDWPSLEGVKAKIHEELQELEQAQSESLERTREEFGDLLFACANLARKLKLNPEDALQYANSKFERRFRSLETELRRRGQSSSELSIAELEQLWSDVKRAERS